MDIWLATSLQNLYIGNTMLCAKQGMSKAECEKRIEETLRKIQWRTEKVCGKDKDCNDKWMEFIIDSEEIDKLRAKLLLTYT